MNIHLRDENPLIRRLFSVNMDHLQWETQDLIGSTECTTQNIQSKIMKSEKRHACLVLTLNYNFRKHIPRVNGASFWAVNDLRLDIILEWFGSSSKNGFGWWSQKENRECKNSKMLAYFHKTQILSLKMGQLQDPRYWLPFNDIWKKLFGTSSNLRLAVGGSQILYNKSSYTHSQTFQKSFRGINKFYLVFISLLQKTFSDSLKTVYALRCLSKNMTKRLSSFVVFCTVPQCTCLCGKCVVDN